MIVIFLLCRFSISPFWEMLKKTFQVEASSESEGSAQNNGRPEKWKNMYFSKYYSMEQVLQWANIHPTWGGSAIHSTPVQSDTPLVSPKSSAGELHRLFLSPDMLFCCAGHGCHPSVSPWSRLVEIFSVSPLHISPFFSSFVVAMTLLLEINILQVTKLSSIFWRQVFHLDSLRMSERSSKGSVCWGEGGSLHVTEFLGAILTHSHLGLISID